MQTKNKEELREKAIQKALSERTGKQEFNLSTIANPVRSKEKEPKKEITFEDRKKDTLEKYGPNGTKTKHILVEDSFCKDEETGKYKIQIVCSEENCGSIRWVHTSDLHQVVLCEEHTKEEKRKKRAEANRKRNQRIREELEASKERARLRNVK